MPTETPGGGPPASSFSSDPGKNGFNLPVKAWAADMQIGHTRQHPYPAMTPYGSRQVREPATPGLFPGTSAGTGAHRQRPSLGTAAGEWGSRPEPYGHGSHWSAWAHVCHLLYSACGQAAFALISAWPRGHVPQILSKHRKWRCMGLFLSAPPGYRQTISVFLQAHCPFSLYSPWAEAGVHGVYLVLSTALADRGIDYKRARNTRRPV